MLLSFLRAFFLLDGAPRLLLFSSFGLLVFYLCVFALLLLHFTIQAALQRARDNRTSTLAKRWE